MVKINKLGEETMVEEKRIEVCDDVVQNVSQKQISPPTTQYYRHGTWFYASFHSTLIMIVASGRFSGELFQDVPSFQQSGFLEFFNFPRWFGVCIAILTGCVLSYFAAELLIVILEHDKQKFKTFSQQPLRPKLNEGQKLIQCVFLVCGGLLYNFSLNILSDDILQFSSNYLPSFRLLCLSCIILERFWCFLPDFHLLRFASLAGILVSICYPILSIAWDIIQSFINKATIDVKSKDVKDGDRNGGLMVWITICVAFVGMLTVSDLKQRRKTLASSLVFLMFLVVGVILVVCVDDNISGRPTWLVITAKTMVFLQIAAGCQMFSMVSFLAVEKGLFKQIIEQPTGILRWIFRMLFTISMIIACLYAPMFSVVIGSFVGHAIYLGTSILPFVIALKFFRNEIPKVWKISYVITIVFVTLFTIFATFIYFQLFRSME